MSQQGLPKPRITVSDIKEQAEQIRKIAQSIIDACESGGPISPYARDKATGGGLAADAAILGVLIVAREYQEG